MNPTNTYSVRRLRQRGVSLIELLVGLALGLAVLVGLSAVYVAAKQSFRYQETSGRMTEDASFALDSIAKEVRMTGFAGCMGISSTTVAGVTTYSPNSGLVSPIPTPTGIDGPNPLSMVETANIGVTVQPLTPLNFLRGFDGGVSATMFTTAPSYPTTSSSLFVAGGSMNVVSPSVAMVAATDSLTLATDPYKWNTFSTNSGVIDFIISDCTKSSLFRGKVTASGAIFSVAHGTTLGNAAANFPANVLYDTKAMIMPLEWKYFYVATRSGAVTPSLYVDSYNGNIRLSSQEIVSNVENMLVHYGEDTSVSTPPAMQADTWRTTAAAVVDWSRVVAVRVGLMMVTSDSKAGLEITQTTPKLLDTAYTIPAGAAANLVRKEFSTTVVLRNRVAPR